jgi:SAM-dependent methyltransferase
VSLTPSEFERAYLSAAAPTAQSGCNTGPEGWEIGRRPLADAIHRPGTFLDVGCANGLLMESIVEWSPHRIEPYGVDFAPGLVELARERLPQWADRIFLGDALEWEPPRRFDFVRTELVYAPADRRRELADRLVGWLEPGGRVLVWATAIRCELRCARGATNRSSSASGARRAAASTSWRR